MDVRALVGVDGSGDPFASLAGVPMLARSVRMLLSAGVAAGVTVLVAAEQTDRAVAACAGLPVTVVAARLHTSASLPSPLDAISAHVRERADPASGDGRIAPGPGSAGRIGVVVVQDALRPLAPPALAAAVLAAVRAGHRAAVPALPLTDTVKRVDAAGLLHGSADRAVLRVVQSPVAFRADLLDIVPTGNPMDLVRACAAAGEPLHTVPGHPMAFPVRTAADRELAEAMLAGSVEP